VSFSVFYCPFFSFVTLFFYFPFFLHKQGAVTGYQARGEVRPEQKKNNARGGKHVTTRHPRREPKKGKNQRVDQFLSFFTCQPICREERSRACGGPCRGRFGRTKKNAWCGGTKGVRTVDLTFFFCFFYLATTQREGRSGWATRLCPAGAKGWLRGQELRAARGLRRDGRAAEKGKNGRCNQQQLNEISTETQQSRLLKESARVKRLLGQSSNLEFFFGFSGGR
jgi:hypothetical protein